MKGRCPGKPLVAVVQTDKPARTPAYAADATVVSLFEALDLGEVGKHNAKMVQIEMVVVYLAT